MSTWGKDKNEIKEQDEKDENSKYALRTLFNQHVWKFAFKLHICMSLTSTISIRSEKKQKKSEMSSSIFEGFKKKKIKRNPQWIFFWFQPLSTLYKPYYDVELILFNNFKSFKVEITCCARKRRYFQRTTLVTNYLFWAHHVQGYAFYQFNIYILEIFTVESYLFMNNHTV